MGDRSSILQNQLANFHLHFMKYRGVLGVFDYFSHNFAQNFTNFEIITPTDFFELVI